MEATKVVWKACLGRTSRSGFGLDGGLKPSCSKYFVAWYAADLRRYRARVAKQLRSGRLAAGSRQFKPPR